MTLTCIMENMLNVMIVFLFQEFGLVTLRRVNFLNQYFHVVVELNYIKKVYVFVHQVICRNNCS